MTTEEAIEKYLEKAQISELLVRYFRAVDDKQLNSEIVAATFTNDARIVRPNGSELVGHKDILEGHLKSFARFKATHHVTTDHMIDINEKTATIQTNLTAMHVWANSDNNPALDNKHFLAGGVLHATARKVENQWRLGELINRNVWRTGEGMTEMANYERPRS
jgi:ketosteroid isomerase-like protein